MLLTYKKEDGAAVKVRLKTVSQAKPITIGRGDEADITIGDPKASRVHSAIRYWDDIFIIRDMDSRNGTFVNGKRIDVSKLGAGDVIAIGDTKINVLAEDESETEITLPR